MNFGELLSNAERLLGDVNLEFSYDEGNLPCSRWMVAKVKKALPLLKRALEICDEGEREGIRKRISILYFMLGHYATMRSNEFAPINYAEGIEFMRLSLGLAPKGEERLIAERLYHYGKNSGDVAAALDGLDNLCGSLGTWIRDGLPDLAYAHSTLYAEAGKLADERGMPKLAARAYDGAAAILFGLKRLNDEWALEYSLSLMHRGAAHWNCGEMGVAKECFELALPELGALLERLPLRSALRSEARKLHGIAKRNAKVLTRMLQEGGGLPAVPST